MTSPNTMLTSAVLFNTQKVFTGELTPNTPMKLLKLKEKLPKNQLPRLLPKNKHTKSAVKSTSLRMTSLSPLDLKPHQRRNKPSPLPGDKPLQPPRLLLLLSSQEKRPHQVLLLPMNPNGTIPPLSNLSSPSAKIPDLTLLTLKLLVHS